MVQRLGVRELEEAFNSFPVAARSSAARQRTLCSATAFNSFPVAAGCGRVEEVPGGAELSILSQLLQQLLRAYAGVLAGIAFQFFPSCCRGLCLVPAYKLFLFPSEVGKTASHPSLTHGRLPALSTSEFVNPGLKRELLPCSLLKIRLPTGSFWIK